MIVVVYTLTIGSVHPAYIYIYNLKKIYIYIYMDPSHLKNSTHIVYYKVPTTQLAKMSIDPKFVALTADVRGILL